MKTSNKIIASVFAALLLAPSVNALKAGAAVRYDELDNLFQATLNGILGYENVEEASISAEKEILYDINLEELGVLYSFRCDEQEGFAILIDDGELKVTEITTDGSSPYEDEATNVYISEGLYWYNDDGVFYDCISDLPISEETIETVSETAYFGAIELKYSSEQINYTYRSETPYNILWSIPTYDYGKLNGCVPIAGTNLIAYLDKTYPNLIPDYEPGTSFLGRYSFKSGNDTIYAVSDILYADMGATISSGATISDFRSGMKKYVNRQGYNISFSSLMSWGKIKFDTAKSVVQQGKPIALFLSGHTSTTITTGEGYDMLNYETSNGNHAVAGFGCLEVTYPTAAVGMFSFSYAASSNGASLPNMQMTGCVILFLPVFILFLALKDLFMGNLTVGGLKG